MLILSRAEGESIVLGPNGADLEIKVEKIDYPGQKATLTFLAQPSWPGDPLESPRTLRRDEEVRLLSDGRPGPTHRSV